MAAKPTFEKFLVETQKVTAEAMKAASDEALAKKITVNQSLIEKKVLSEEALAENLARFSGLDYQTPPLTPDKDLCNQIPAFTLRRYRVIPLSKTDQQITVATANPGNFLATDELRRLTKLAVKSVVTTDSAIETALNSLQGGAAPGPSKPEENATTGNKIDQLIARSISRGASDLHFEPQLKFCIVRERIDGVLHEVERTNPDIFGPLISRIKLLSGMDIVEKRLAQDGRFRFKSAKGSVEVRASTMPTIYGEKVVLRLLRTDRSDPTIDGLDIGPERAELLRKLCDLPDGLILVAGPTGSGKTTTIYSMLSSLDRKTQNLITVEDPVEYEMELSAQVQINQKIGVTFEAILPSILRQDPDIIMVGEVRDEETAQMVMRSAISGHLVFSTIHAPTALATVARLIDMGAQPHMVVASLKACVSQRLVRKLCQSCKRPKEASKADIQLLGLDPNQTYTIFEEMGCDLCHNLGYLGRFAAIEILLVNDDLAEAILTKDKRLMESVARKQGYKTMKEHGAERVLTGETSVREVIANCP